MKILLSVLVFGFYVGISTIEDVHAAAIGAVANGDGHKVCRIYHSETSYSEYGCGSWNTDASVSVCCTSKCGASGVNNCTVTNNGITTSGTVLGGSKIKAIQPLKLFK